MSTLRLYYDDAECWQFQATVVECRPAGAAWEAVLDRTAFYPASGGQPYDTGRLGGRQVLTVVDDEATGEVIHRLDGPISGQVAGSIDGLRRRDHMEQHTGQHLLSQACLLELGAETVSFHMGAEDSTIDIALPDPTAAAMARVEDRANAVVRQDLSVQVHYADTERQLSLFPLRRPPAVTGRVRVVEVADFDWSACGGTHVRTTGQIGLIHIKAWERYKKGTRVSFLCGGRAISDYRTVDGMVRDLCQGLSIPAADLPVTVNRFREETGRLRKALAQAQDTLVEAEARALLDTVRPVLGGLRVARVTFSARPVEEVRALAIKAALHSHTVALFGTRGALPQLIFARSQDLRLDMNAVLQAALAAIHGRGGGGPAFAQGGGTHPDGLHMALDLAYAQVLRVMGGET